MAAFTRSCGMSFRTVNGEEKDRHRQNDVECSAGRQAGRSIDDIRYKQCQWCSPYNTQPDPFSLWLMTVHSSAEKPQFHSGVDENAGNQTQHRIDYLDQKPPIIAKMIADQTGINFNTRGSIQQSAFQKRLQIAIVELPICIRKSIWQT